MNTNPLQWGKCDKNSSKKRNSLAGCEENVVLVNEMKNDQKKERKAETRKENELNAGNWQSAVSEMIFCVIQNFEPVPSITRSVRMNELEEEEEGDKNTN